jgi:hypothetical protein
MKHALITLALAGLLGCGQQQDTASHLTPTTDGNWLRFGPAADGLVQIEATQIVDGQVRRATGMISEADSRLLQWAAGQAITAPLAQVRIDFEGCDRVLATHDQATGDILMFETGRRPLGPTCQLRNWPPHWRLAPAG